ncbi:colanic acid/amylovoran biosynthesis glycosyltransferase [Salinimicrobium sediminis]|uniref:Colanic acid/amylovoran biosynthesis glycosyltransferase n=1 Tax=Salinimicrobium sediminis TaxID=1343891 RepID=A0A285WZR5_9FLAO|nr:glycosyltransferase family 4 protein [Salinimicrobium sediminis]SOC78562.1 colanic acid/amylovoran biosynthesis glycosyltransferase [Salinimicrobium sediminis]
MPLKIVVFEGSLQPPVFIRRLMEGLAEEGHSIYLLHFGGNISPSKENLKYLSLGSSQNNIQLIFQSLKIAFDYNIFATFFTFKKIVLGNRKNLQKRNLKVLLNELEPDIIHVQWPALLEVLEEVINEGKYPVVLSQRGYQINVKPFVNNSYFQKLSSIFPKLSGFHSVSKAISQEGDKIWNSPAKLDEVVYTGLDLQGFQFQENYSRNEKLKLITVGRPHWKKGLHDAIHACAILFKKDVEFEITIIGGKGNEEILFLTNMYKLEERVNILGKLPQKKVYELMTEADLLIVSSLEEGIPNVLVEAMVLGIPVISTSCGGVEELIAHDREGWVVPTRDPAALAGQIELFTTLPEESIEIVRKAAREKVENQHSSNQMIRGMESLYKKVLQRSKI